MLNVFLVQGDKVHNTEKAKAFQKSDAIPIGHILLFPAFVSIGSAM
jgi:hypothetical protein